MMVLKKDNTVGYTDVSILPYYKDEIKYCVINIGNKLKGPMCVLDTPEHLLSMQDIGELGMTVTSVAMDADNMPIDEMEYTTFTFHSNILEEWYSILPIFDQFILLNEFYEQHLSYNIGLNIGNIILYETNKEPKEYPISFWLDNTVGYQDILTRHNHKLFGNINRSLFNCRTVNTPDLDSRVDFITIGKGKWKEEYYELGGFVYTSKHSKNITRTCKRLLADNIDYLLYPISPSIAYMISLDEYIRLENILRLHLTLTEEYPDAEGSSNDVSVPDSLERHVQLSMTVNNYLSLMTSHIYAPGDRYFYPGIYLELRGVDTLKNGRERKNLSISIDPEYIYKNKFPIYSILNMMVEEGWDWR